MNEEMATRVLRDVKEVFDHRSVEFWLESGTLLGAVREKSFIPWDDDIDLGTLDKNIPKMKALAKDFCERGFETYFSPYHNSMAVKRDGISVDLVFWRLDNDRAIMPLLYIENLAGRFLFNVMWIILYSHNGKINRETLNSVSKKVKFALIKLTDLLPGPVRVQLAKFTHVLARNMGNRRGLVVTPSRFFLNLSDIAFYGMTFRIPAEKEDYLEYYFGEDWRAPRKDWEYWGNGDKEELLSKTEHPGEKWEYWKNSLSPTEYAMLD